MPDPLRAALVRAGLETCVTLGKEELGYRMRKRGMAKRQAEAAARPDPDEAETTAEAVGTSPLSRVHEDACVATGKLELAHDKAAKADATELAHAAAVRLRAAAARLERVPEATPTLAVEAATLRTRLSQAAATVEGGKPDIERGRALSREATADAGRLVAGYARLTERRGLERERLAILQNAQDEGLSPRETLARLRRLERGGKR